MRRFIRRTLRRLGFNVSKYLTNQERFDDVDQYMADQRASHIR